jgi:glycosyltransferase involved in cell wall biosynthesis
LGADDLWNVQTSKISDFNERTSTALIIGRWQIYKNLHTVLDAIYQSNDEIIKNLHLIVLGKSDKLGKNLVLESVKQFEAHLGRLRLIEYLEEPHLKYLYNKVDLVIHPSINEGFGIPAFEAFGEGAKIVVHRGTPADEYLSMYPGVFAENLLEHKKIENAILQALKSKKVNKKIRRKIIKNYGMTWENLALKTLKSYEQVKSNK